MHRILKFAFSAVLFVALLPMQPARAEDLASVLARLDAAAKNFHTTTADFEFDTIQTDPIPDTDKMTGTAYYEREGSSLPDGRTHHQRQQPPRRKGLYLFRRRAARIRYRQRKRCPVLHAGWQVRELSDARLRRQRQAILPKSGRSNTWAQRTSTASQPTSSNLSPRIPLSARTFPRSPSGSIRPAP